MKGNRIVKCLVWDLDDTLWEGTLAEGDDVRVRHEAAEAIKTLDERGVLQSVSSRNEFGQARAKLEEIGLWEYFIYPQIDWGAKSAAIQRIADSVNIGVDAMAFIDDQRFELDEVGFALPGVLCIEAADAGRLASMPEFSPANLTEDSKNRRKMYQLDIARNESEAAFKGTAEEFLETLGMVLTISRADESDLARAEDLTVRTHQLNSTGYTYSYDELRSFIGSEKHELLVAQLDDRYGCYGKIGLALIEKKRFAWTLNLLLMSCRVMSKGVGAVFLNFIVNAARKKGFVLNAQFVPTDRNKIMYVTYKFNGFEHAKTRNGVEILRADLSYERRIPGYVELRAEPL